MLYERGPLDLFPEAAFPRAGEPAGLDTLAGHLASDLDAHAAAIGEQQSTMADDDSARALEAGALDLGAADDELARQAGALDASIGDVADGAGAQHASLPSLTNESAADVVAGEPADPGYVEHPLPAAPPPEVPPEVPPEPPPPGGTVGDLVIFYYQKYLRRTPTTDEINGWSQLWPN